MTADQIRSLGPDLSDYLDEFSDCFKVPETRLHLKDYVRGQLSDLPRKSVEPMARLADVPPRTLQEFLSLSDWDHDLLRTRLQQIVTRDHADPNAIGIVDESGHPKKGSKTACVQRQYCGTTGKIDNCVMTVHLAYASWDNAFRVLIDGDLFLPESWDASRQRRESVRIPAGVHYRPKYDIALEQLRRARANGVHFGWVTADEWYGGKGPFVLALEQMKQKFVLEVPRNLLGWLHRPLTGPRGGVPPRDVQGSTLEDLCRHSRRITGQKWKRLHVKDTQKGPMVCEVRTALWWTEREGRIAGPYRLLVARDVLDRSDTKYFLSGEIDEDLRVLVHVAFSRWPVERCLEDQKSELGLSHFECRKYPAVLRHLLLTQVSCLFLARQCRRMRGEKRPRQPARDPLPDPHGGMRLAGGVGAAPTAAARHDRTHGRRDWAYAKAQRRRDPLPRQSSTPQAAGDRHPGRAAPDVHSAMTR
jgi:SRSO17 transposase